MWNVDIVILRAAALVPLAMALLLPSGNAGAQECKYRGDLDALYCDDNKDMVADTPKDPKKLKYPGTIVFTYSPVEDPAVYEKAFAPFTDYLGKCLVRKVVFHQVQSYAAEIEALRSGRLHVGGFSPGATIFAVNLAGAVPFGVVGNEKEYLGYNLIVVVKKSSPFMNLADLKGKKVAHVAPASNSGHMAPMSLFPTEGLVPGKDYKILFSGKHDQSIMGVNSGDYDAAAVGSTVFERMVSRGQIKEDDFRVIYKSQKFPQSSFAYAHDLDPALAAKMVKCFYDYRLPTEMQKTFDGADRFFPVTYQKDWEIVRKVAADSGEVFNRATFEKQNAKEAEAAAKKASETKKP